MPVVIGGSTQVTASKAGGSGIRGVGFSVPAGSLDNLRAAMANHASQLVELPYFGDSTGYGSGSTTGGVVRKIRDLLLAAGLTDGGRGVASYSETAASSGESLAPFVSRTGWASAGHAYDFLNTDTLGSAVNGDVMTWTGKGTAIRLYATRYGGSGTYTYNIDGAGAVTVDATAPGGVTADIQTTYIGGLTEGTHTIVITNTSGGAFVVPEFIRTAGVVVHKQAISGISTSAYFNRTLSSNSGFANGPALAALGLQQRTGQSPPNSMDYGLAIAAKPTTRNVPAAFYALGINDQQGQATDDTTVYTTISTMVEGVGLFARMCRQANIDPIIVIEHFVFASHAELYSSRCRTAIATAADAHGCTWVDYNAALGPISSGNWTGAPHLAQSQYDVEATFLFNKVLALTLPGAF